MRAIWLLLLVVACAAASWLDPTTPRPYLKGARKYGEEVKLTFCDDSEIEGEQEFYVYSEQAANSDFFCKKHLGKVHYSNKINKTGWAYLEVETSRFEIPAPLQGYVAGYLEGRATQDIIYWTLKNTIDGYCDHAEKYCQQLYEFMLENTKWMIREIQEHPNDQYWIQVNVTLNQLFGIIDGYEGKMNSRRTIEDIVAHPIFLMQLGGDIEDLQIKFRKPENPHQIKRGRGRCSALVKLLPDNSDLFTSHVTWTTYSSMLRFQKKYTFKLRDSKGRALASYAFSGYASAIASIDDFIVTSAKLGIFETTIGNNNEDLYKYTTPKSVMCWIRTQIAFRLSTTGADWAYEFGKHNSGTYNNQWVIVDYKLFKRGAPLPEHGLVHVLEQMPHYIVHADKTKFVAEHKYWPSYNSPYFKQIQNVSHVQDLIDRYGPWYSYDKTPRALIFKRDHPKITDIDGMIRLMRSNNYTADPLSRCNCSPPYSAENAISCRSELNPANGTYEFPSLGFRDHGATDMKVTTSKLIGSHQFIAIAGPTHDPTPVFDWRTAPFDNKVPHYAQPDRWEFGSVQHQWRRDGLFARSDPNADALE